MDGLKPRTENHNKKEEGFACMCLDDSLTNLLLCSAPELIVPARVESTLRRRPTQTVSRFNATIEGYNSMCKSLAFYLCMEVVTLRYFHTGQEWMRNQLTRPKNTSREWQC